MKLTKVIAIWEKLHVKDLSEIRYCDLEKAIESIVGVENDIDSNQPQDDVNNNQPVMTRLQRLDSSNLSNSDFFHLARKYAAEADELQKQLQNELLLRHATISELLAELTIRVNCALQ